MYEYSGVTPILVFNTGDLNGSESVQPVQIDEDTVRLISDRGGVCKAMVVDWIYKSQLSGKAGSVTEVSQLKGGMALGLAQTAYARCVFDDPEVGMGSRDVTFMASQGLTARKVRASSETTGGIEKLLSRSAGLNGFASIGIVNVDEQSGHCFGFRQRGGLIQLFDPNIGAMQFNSFTDFAKWFPAFVANKYPNLLQVFTIITMRN